MWYPNRDQWRVICGVYVIALLSSVDWTQSRIQVRPPTPEEDRREKVLAAEDQKLYGDPVTQMEVRRKLNQSESNRRRDVEQFDPSIDPGTLVLLVVIGGALWVWRLQHSRNEM